VVSVTPLSSLLVLRRPTLEELGALDKHRNLRELRSEKMDFATFAFIRVAFVVDRGPGADIGPR
jgi:hypothetical protein